jgi:transposase InsO family protein|tara:strand:- start:586 stop:1503 length:918 start_codon:yes stop_codon:yes gene_type:complete
MSAAYSIATHKRYGLQRVCRIWQRPRSTVYAQRRSTAVEGPLDADPPLKRGPMGPCGDADLVDHIRGVLADSPFHGEGYRKVWAKLRFAGLRTSKERVRRLMREHGLQAPQRVGHPHGPKAHDGTIITQQPDVMWGTDATTTITLEGGQAHVFVGVDHCTFECIGLHASAEGNRFEALEPIRQGVRDYLGGYTAHIAEGLKIRHDHGSVYLSDDFQDELDFLGMESSPSFVREPQGNGCAERFIGLLKENLLWVCTFSTIEQLRQALLEFKQQYNEQWILQRHGYKTPTQVRQEKREIQYTEAAG